MRQYRKVIQITALDSPNVRREMARLRGDPESSWPPETPGVLSYDEYQKRLSTWDAPRQAVGLEARFWKGADALLYPPHWLDHSASLARGLRGKRRRARGIGIDPGEGTADTSMAAVDELGVIELLGKKTSDTDVIPGDAIDFMRRHDVPPEATIFDRGGGGKQHADRLRKMGYPVRTLAFGGSATPEPSRRRKRREEVIDEREGRTAFLNLRALLYWDLRELIDPSGENGGFAIPEEYASLRHQLAPIPLTRDGEGVFYVLPKNKKDPDSKQKTLTELIGRSPDDADAVVLACHAFLHPQRRAVAGAAR